MPRIGTVNYNVHRPHRQAYHIDVGGQVGRLVPPQLSAVAVEVRDVRRGEARVDFARDSLAFEHAPSAVQAFGDDSGWTATYDAEIEALLVRMLGVRAVRVFDHTLRVDDPAEPRRPARHVHSDYSPAGARARLTDLLGEPTASTWAAGHYAFINVWRPVAAPVVSAPLGFVRPASVSAEDWVLLDLVYPERIGQIMGLVAGGAHEWIYQSRMTPDEVAVFNIYDNRGQPSIAHSAMDLFEEGGACAVRRSIETRTLVRY